MKKLLKNKNIKIVMAFFLCSLAFTKINTNAMNEIKVSKQIHNNNFVREDENKANYNLQELKINDTLKIIENKLKIMNFNYIKSSFLYLKETEKIINNDKEIFKNKNDKTICLSKIENLNKKLKEQINKKKEDIEDNIKKAENGLNLNINQIHKILYEEETKIKSNKEILDQDFCEKMIKKISEIKNEKNKLEKEKYKEIMSDIKKVEDLEKEILENKNKMQIEDLKKIEKNIETLIKEVLNKLKQSKNIILQENFKKLEEKYNEIFKSYDIIKQKIEYLEELKIYNERTFSEKIYELENLVLTEEEKKSFETDHPNYAEENRMFDTVYEIRELIKKALKETSSKAVEEILYQIKKAKIKTSNPIYEKNIPYLEKIEKEFKDGKKQIKEKIKKLKKEESFKKIKTKIKNIEKKEEKNLIDIKNKLKDLEKIKQTLNQDQNLCEEEKNKYLTKIKELKTEYNNKENRIKEYNEKIIKTQIANYIKSAEKAKENDPKTSLFLLKDSKNYLTTYKNNLIPNDFKNLIEKINKNIEGIEREQIEKIIPNIQKIKELSKKALDEKISLENLEKIYKEINLLAKNNQCPPKEYEHTTRKIINELTELRNKIYKKIKYQQELIKKIINNIKTIKNKSTEIKEKNKALDEILQNETFITINSKNPQIPINPIRLSIHTLKIYPLEKLAKDKENTVEKRKENLNKIKKTIEKFNKIFSNGYIENYKKSVNDIEIIIDKIEPLEELINKSDKKNTKTIEENLNKIRNEITKISNSNYVKLCKIKIDKIEKNINEEKIKEQIKQLENIMKSIKNDEYIEKVKENIKKIKVSLAKEKTDDNLKNYKKNYEETLKKIEEEIEKEEIKKKINEILIQNLNINIYNFKNNNSKTQFMLNIPQQKIEKIEKELNELGKYYKIIYENKIQISQEEKEKLETKLINGINKRLEILINLIKSENKYSLYDIEKITNILETYLKKHEEYIKSKYNKQITDSILNINNRIKPIKECINKLHKENPARKLIIKHLNEGKNINENIKNITNSITYKFDEDEHTCENIYKSYKISTLEETKSHLEELEEEMKNTNSNDAFGADYLIID